LALWPLVGSGLGRFTRGLDLDHFDRLGLLKDLFPFLALDLFGQ
jgi:hypothetical protein